MLSSVLNSKGPCVGCDTRSHCMHTGSACRSFYKHAIGGKSVDKTPSFAIYDELFDDSRSGVRVASGKQVLAYMVEPDHEKTTVLSDVIYSIYEDASGLSRESYEGDDIFVRYNWIFVVSKNITRIPLAAVGYSVESRGKYVAYLNVRRKHQRKGYGSMLMDMVEKDSRVALIPDTIEAREYYVGRGYVDGEGRELMEKGITQNAT